MKFLLLLVFVCGVFCAPFAWAVPPQKTGEVSKNESSSKRKKGWKSVKGAAKLRRTFGRRTKRPKRKGPEKAGQISSLRVAGKIQQVDLQKRLRRALRDLRRCLRGRVTKKIEPVNAFFTIRYGEIVSARLSLKNKDLHFNRVCVRKLLVHSWIRRWSRDRRDTGTLEATVAVRLLY